MLLDTATLTDKDYEIARKAVEDIMVEFRDSRIGQLRNNGMVIKESDGRDSHIIRLGVEDVIRIGLAAIVKARA